MFSGLAGTAVARHCRFGRGDHLDDAGGRLRIWKDALAHEHNIGKEFCRCLKILAESFEWQGSRRRRPRIPPFFPAFSLDFSVVL